MCGGVWERGLGGTGGKGGAGDEKGDLGLRGILVEGREWGLKRRWLEGNTGWGQRVGEKGWMKEGRGLGSDIHFGLKGISVDRKKG